MKITIATAANLEELSQLYVSSVRSVATGLYSEDQLRVWAAFANSSEMFQEFILNATTYIASDESCILGFSGIAENGHIPSLYVRGDCFRQGIGSNLLIRVVDHAVQAKIPELYSEASEFSYPLFLKFGFLLTDTERIERDGVEFLRYLVRRKNEHRSNL